MQALSSVRGAPNVIVNRPSVAGAVLQTASSLIDSVTDWLMVGGNIFTAPPNLMVGDGAFSHKIDYVGMF